MPAGEKFGKNTINHKIYARHQGVAADARLSIPLIKQCIRGALQIEGVDLPCEVSVLIADDHSIRELNREFRGVDKPTDVLSFPVQEFSQPGWAARDSDSLHQEAGLLPLGDIILSAQRVDKQAREHAQTRESETAYLTVHSVLHLLGYDHIDEAEEKKRMREREKDIIYKLRIGRGSKKI